MLIQLALILALQAAPWETPTYQPCVQKQAGWADEQWARAEAYCYWGQKGRIRYKVIQETDFELTAHPAPGVDNDDQRRTPRSLYIRYQVGFLSPFGFVVSGESTESFQRAFERAGRIQWPPLGSR